MKRLAILLIGTLLVNGACRWQPYGVNRTIRQLTGQKARVHLITPLQTDLSQYKTLEVSPLENLMLDKMPPETQRYLNDKLFDTLRSLKRFNEVVRYRKELPPEDDPATPPALILEGQIDDFHPGYLGLRIFELGYNHISMTVRFQLRDKQTGSVLGSGSISVHENRPNGTPKAAADRIVKELKKLLRSEF